MRPLAMPSSGQVKTKPLGQWSQRPGWSTKPYSPVTGYWPKGSCRSVPALEVTRIRLAFSSRRIPACTRW